MIDLILTFLAITSLITGIYFINKYRKSRYEIPFEREIDINDDISGNWVKYDKEDSVEREENSDPIGGTQEKLIIKETIKGPKRRTYNKKNNSIKDKESKINKKSEEKNTKRKKSTKKKKDKDDDLLLS